MSIDQDEKPEGYAYWLKTVAKAALPRASDWYRVGERALDAIKAILWSAGMTAFRLAVLFTLPVTAPILARVCQKLNERTCARRNATRAEMRSNFMNLAQRARQRAELKEEPQ